MLQYVLMSDKSDFEAELAELPKGTIIRRTIRGTERFYHQWREDGVTKSRYLSPGEILPLRAKLERRKYLQGTVPQASNPNPQTPQPPNTRVARRGTVPGTFRCDVLTGGFLAEYAAGVNQMRKRDCFFTLFQTTRSPAAELPGTVPIESAGTVPKSAGTVPTLFLVGHRGTGKTTLLRQFIHELPPTIRAKAAYLRLTGEESAADLTADLSLLRDLGFRHVFIDEAHRLTGLTGTGLTLVLAGEFIPAALAGEVSAVDISFIPFREFAHLTDINNPSVLIERGGTLGPVPQYFGGTLGPVPQSSNPNTQAPNPPNTRATHLRGTVPGAEDTNVRKNDRFLLDVLALSAIRGKDAAREHGEAFLGTDLQKLRNRFAELSGLTDSDDVSTREALLAEPPYRRYAQARMRLALLLEDPIIDRLGAAERKLIRDILRTELRFRLLEDIVWDELRHAHAERSAVRVHRVPFAPGRYGFVIADDEELSCEIVVVTTDAERDPPHQRYIDDPSRLDVLEHRYGTITSREILYNGRDARLTSGVVYRNLAKYLTRLGS